MTIKRFLRWPYIVPVVAVAAPVIIVIFIVVTGGIVMLLWNWLLPPLFALPRITIWQGFGLLMLCRILFGGFGGGGGKHSKQISQEERERFRQRMRDRFRRTTDEGPESPASEDAGGNAPTTK